MVVVVVVVVVVVERASISDAGTTIRGGGEEGAVFACRTVSPFGALHDNMKIAKITRLNNSQSAYPCGSGSTPVASFDTTPLIDPPPMW